MSNTICRGARVLVDGCPDVQGQSPDPAPFARDPLSDPAPFRAGDRVLCHRRSAGPETVELIEWSRHGAGGGGWYVQTVRRVGPTETRARRYGRAEDFDLIASLAEVPIIGPSIVKRRLRRLARLAGGILLTALVLGVAWGALVEFSP